MVYRRRQNGRPDGLYAGAGLHGVEALWQPDLGIDPGGAGQAV